MRLPRLYRAHTITQTGCKILWCCLGRKHGRCLYDKWIIGYGDDDVDSLVEDWVDFCFERHELTAFLDYIVERDYGDQHVTPLTAQISHSASAEWASRTESCVELTTEDGQYPLAFEVVGFFLRDRGRFN